MSNVIMMCDSLTPGKIRKIVFAVMSRVHGNPRWRTNGRGLSVHMRLVQEGTDSSFPCIMLTINNVLAVRSLPCVFCKYKWKNFNTPLSDS